MTDKQALNKKTAEWAGFVEAKKKSSYPPQLYSDPEGKPCYISTLDFTDSLDACFKWLVPELSKRGLATQVISYYQSAFDKWTYRVRIGISDAITYDNPALALCLAIEKLIDGGK